MVCSILPGCGGAVGSLPQGSNPPSGRNGQPGQRADRVDPNACGGYATTDLGKKIKAFLTATAALDKAVADARNHVEAACRDMGRTLGVADLSGDTQALCQRVAAALRASLQAGIRADAHLDIQYKPAVCTVSADATAAARAECAGSAQAGAGGGSADAACASSAEVRASLAAECTPAELNVSYGADVVVDKAKLEAAVAAIRTGLPKLLDVYGRMRTVQRAAQTWARTAADLAQSANSFARDLGNHALCVSGQLAAAAAAAVRVMASIEITVSVSVEVSASAGATL
ncbi:MAG: hypothetical protein D6689_19880 [Deltaproteobacteria bacterium]|nr:MAG: hypothetical protein D6689_19880 [Deltaproteobacteria bacterium]